MSEAVIIQYSSGAPLSIDAIRDDLLALGVRSGDTLLVHSSLSTIGWVCGGPVSVIMALESALTVSGTLVMPAHTSHVSDPALWCNPTVRPDWVDKIRETMPAFDPDVTPTRGMGVIPECFRSQADVLRSNHPHDSFVARGPHAGEIVSDHPLQNGLGENSPLGALYDLDAKVLLLGVGHESNTSLHLAEYRARYPNKRDVTNGAPVLVGGKRRWATIRHLDYKVSDFNRIGHAFAQETRASSFGYIGRAQSILFSMRDLVDYAVGWMEQNR